MPATGSAAASDDDDTARVLIVVDHRYAAAGHELVFEHRAEHHAADGSDAVEPRLDWQHDVRHVQRRERNDVIECAKLGGHDAPKIGSGQEAVTVLDAGAQQRARLDAVTGKSCRSGSSGCAGTIPAATSARKFRRQCVHWIRVRSCARSEPRQHRQRLEALSAATATSWLERVAQRVAAPR